MQDLPERVSVNLVGLHRNWRLNHHETEFTQVSEEDPDHAERKIDVGSDVYHRRRHLRELQDRKVLRTEPARIRYPGPGTDHRGDQVKGLAGMSRTTPS
jgi:hypothetical protein